MSNLNNNLPTKQQIQLYKIIIFILCLIPLLHLVLLGFQEKLSANPIEYIERSTGFWALINLLVTLILTPIRLITGIGWQIQFRRMFGLFMFFYVCLHIAIYLWLDFSFDWNAIGKDISKHPRILVGFFAFLLSIPLAITSNNFMIKLLKKRWKKIHQLVYLIAILAIVHFWWLVKKDIREPLLYGSILLTLLSIRLYFKYAKPIFQVR